MFLEPVVSRWGVGEYSSLRLPPSGFKNNNNKNGEKKANLQLISNAFNLQMKISYILKIQKVITNNSYSF